ncbi:protein DETOXIFICATION 16-like [Aegilops tauschii subsp. strangulata]|uniref:Protein DETOXIFICATION n=1 Tax=Aegilops tauschii subsp. strangulata TaxID=200361 RepID=A0A453T2I2_AEGTS|nr:protein DETOXIFICATION 16-like [Aegilops tauschii subsp. strangulata]
MQKPSVDGQSLLGPAEREEHAAAASEAKRLLLLAGPLVASGIVRCALQLVSVMFVGHLGELPLAGASLATSLANVTGFSLLVGMASALDTLCGQAFGARRYGLLGVYKQRAMLVLAVSCVPVALVWASTARILLLLGQDPAIAAEAGAYARWLIPALVPYVPLVCHIRFLQTQSIVVPVMASSAVTSLSHILVCWALVYKAGMGSKGAALATAVSYSTNLAMLSLYTRLSGACRGTWTGFSMEAFKELRQFAELAVPSAMMVCLEWWSFELLVLLSGLLPNPKLETSVLSICLNTGALMFMVPSGLCAAISTRVSNELGAGRPQAARLATRVVVCMAMLTGSVISITMIFLRKSWGYMYSNEEEVVTYIARMIPVLAISFFVDGIHTSLSGVLYGCGEQKIGARVNLTAFYLAGVPLAILLAFVLHLNGMGLWLGIVCGSLTKLVLLVWIVLSINWENESIKAKDMVLGTSLPVA